MSRRGVSASLRRQVLARDGFACVVCGESNPRQLEAHHVVLKSTRVRDLETRCKRHHAEAHGTYWPSAFEMNIRQGWRDYINTLKHL